MHKKLEGSLSGNNMAASQLTGDNQMGEMQGRTQITSDPKDRFTSCRELQNK